MHFHLLAYAEVMLNYTDKTFLIRMYVKDWGLLPVLIISISITCMMHEIARTDERFVVC